MTHPIEEFDQLVLGVRDLALARATWTRLGFVVSGTASEAGYARIAFEPPADRRLAAARQRGLENGFELQEDRSATHEGITGFVLSIVDAKQARAFFERQHEQYPEGGFRPGMPGPIGRAAADPRDVSAAGDGVEFPLPSLPLPVRLRLREHRGAPASAHEAQLAHPNGAKGWISTLFVANDASEYARALEAVWGGTITDVVDGWAASHPGVLSLSIFTPRRLRDTYPEADLGDAREAPYAAGAVVAVQRLDVLAQRLAEGSIPFAGGSNRVVVSPRHTHGVLLVFISG